MAVKRGKKQARRKDESSIPGWTWLLVGVLAGAAIAVGVYVKMPHAVDSLLPHPNPAAQPQTANASNDTPEGNPPVAASRTAASPAATSSAAVASGPKKPKYDFYALLPEKEVIIPDEEVSAQAKAEAAANLASKQQAALAPLTSSTATDAAATAPKTPAATSAAASGTTSTQLDPSTPSVANTATSSTATSSKSTAPATNSTPATASASPATPTPTTPATDKSTAAVPEKSGQYLLQAGAFRNNEQADDLKARIAMLGLIGHVETVQTPAGEMHRVRLGPYATASELEQAKQKLSGGGLPAVAIRVK